jgi:hypothetical protein
MRQRGPPSFRPTRLDRGERMAVQRRADRRAAGPGPYAKRKIANVPAAEIGRLAADHLISAIAGIRSR